MPPHPTALTCFRSSGMLLEVSDSHLAANPPRGHPGLPQGLPRHTPRSTLGDPARPPACAHAPPGSDPHRGFPSGSSHCPTRPHYGPTGCFPYGVSRGTAQTVWARTGTPPLGPSRLDAPGGVRGEGGLCIMGSRVGGLPDVRESHATSWCCLTRRGGFVWGWVGS